MTPLSYILSPLSPTSPDRTRDVNVYRAREEGGGGRREEEGGRREEEDGGNEDEQQKSYEYTY
jgi:hypothetical protein